MFAKLTGIVDMADAAAGTAVIDVGGVGYLVSCSARTMGQLPPGGEAVQLLIETHVREDRIQLFGFASGQEREWFRLLTTVQGVGAKVALAILGVLAPEALTQAIIAQDKTALSRADGVGPRLAARITSELKEKVGSLSVAMVAAAVTATAAGTATGSAAANGVAPGAAAAGVANGSPPTGAAPGVEEAISALLNLGYGRAEAFGAVTHAAGRLGVEAPLDDLIPAALRELAQ